MKTLIHLLQTVFALFTTVICAIAFVKGNTNLMIFAGFVTLIIMIDAQERYHET